MFCSSEDVLQATLTHSDQIISVLRHPKHVLYVLLRHGPMQNAVVLMRKYLKIGTYMWHDWQQQEQKQHQQSQHDNTSPILQTEQFAHAMSVFASVNGISRIAEKHSIPQKNTSQITYIETPASDAEFQARKLLSLEDALQGSKRRIDDMFSLHDAYASQLAQSFDYEYANLYTSATQEAWQMTWPHGVQSLHWSFPHGVPSLHTN